MPDGRRLTLLQLAIFATIALVPVLVAVLLAVDAMRGIELERPARNSDRHISVRHVAALKTFEQAIVRRDAVAGALPRAETLLDRLPQCRKDWEGRGGRLAQFRRWLSGASDTSVSPATRIALELEAIDQALLRFSSGAHRRVTDKVGLDGARWIDAVAAALATPIHTSDYPGHRFTVQCSDIAAAAFALGRGDARMLNALAWRGTEVDRVIARWRPDQYVEITPRHVARANPWMGIPGCTYLARAGNDATAFFVGVRTLDDAVCARPEMLGTSAATARRIPGEPRPENPMDDATWRSPASLSVMLQPLEPLHRPSGALYRAYTQAVADEIDTPTFRHGPNKLELNGSPVDVGFSIDLTIDPEVQALAQQTAACYTGYTEICRALGMQRKEDAGRGIGATMLERAMVRMAAVAIIDVATGRIEALAGSMSPCTREEYDGVGRSPRCDRRIPYPIRYRPDALLNPAVFHDAMPASTIKPIMAAAFLSDPIVGARWLAAEQAEMRRAPTSIPSAQSLRGQLMRSDSARFLDRMFCAETGFAACDRVWAVQKTARAFGWNAACADARHYCGKHDLLFGRNIDTSSDVSPLAFEVAYGRLLAEPLGGKIGAPFHVHPPTPFDPAKARQCAAGADGRRGTKDDWEKCRGRIVVDLAAEGWGQGHARSTALGGAGMMAMLAATANGQTEVRKPHLIEGLRGTGEAPASVLKAGIVRVAPDEPRNVLSRDTAEVILSGLSFGHRAGTSRLACEQVFDVKACQQIDWIAGKTGTPTFPNDDRTLDDFKRLCAPHANWTRDERVACGPLRPYKWYVAAYRTDREDRRWTKAIGVLTERNWIASSGRIHGAGDHGPNPAAEIAMQIAARHVGALSWSGQ